MILLCYLASGLMSCMVLNWFREHRPDVDCLLQCGNYRPAELYLMCLLSGPLVAFWIFANKYR